MFNEISPEKGKQAEAYINGVLRGGTLKDGVFIFHAGTMKIETKEYIDLRILK